MTVPWIALLITEEMSSDGRVLRKKIFVGEGQKRDRLGTDTKGNVLVGKDNLAETTSFLLECNYSLKRSVVDCEDDVCSEFAISWTMNPLFKK